MPRGKINCPSMAVYIFSNIYSWLQKKSQCLRLLYTSQLDPMTLAIQDEIDKNSGLDSDHYGIKSANATPQTLEWPNSIIDFVNYLESTGG